MVSIIGSIATQATERTENYKTRIMVYDILRCADLISGDYLEDDIPNVPQHLTDGIAFSFFRPESFDGYVQWTFTSNHSQSVNSLCLYGHDIFLSNGQFQFQYTTDGVTWYAFHDAISPTDSKPYYIMVEQIDSIIGIRLGVDGLTRSPKVAIAMAGIDLQFQYGQEDGFSEALYSESVLIEYNDSEEGYRIGASQWKDGAQVTLTNSNVTQEWIRETFIPLVAELEPSWPFFCSWDPEFHPDSITYCEIRGTIPAASYSSPLLADIKIPIRAFTA